MNEKNTLVQSFGNKKEEKNIFEICTLTFKR